MINIIGIGGQPGTGKTTLLRQVVGMMGSDMSLKAFGLLRMHWYSDKRTAILGSYLSQDGAFAGTDRLSMAVMPDAIKFLDWLQASPLRTVVFEGDRLFSRKFLCEIIERCVYLRPVFIVLKAPQDELERRYDKRGSNQSPAWRQGRMTKIARIEKTVPGVRTYESESIGDLAALSDALWQTIACRDVEHLLHITQECDTCVQEG